MSLIANALARLADIFDFNPISNRNLFVDGAKETWSIANGANQATTTGGGYGPCVLQIVSAGLGGAGNYARGQAGAAQSSRLGWPRGPNNYGTLNQTVASTGNLASRTGPLMAMRIEDVNYVEGSSITFSVTLQNNGASSITVTQLAAAQNFGTGGSPSANVATIYPVNWVIPNDGVWRRYSARLDIPTTNGKTIGTSTNGFTQISVEFPVGQTFAISDCFWQAEFCSPQAPATGWPTAFEYRGQAAEAQRVERYYETTINFYGVGALNSATVAYVMGRQRTPKRVVPTVTTSGTFTLYALAIGNQAIAAANVSPGPTVDGVLYTVTCSGATAGQPCLLEDNSSTKVIFDARL